MARGTKGQGDGQAGQAASFGFGCLQGLAW